MKITKRKSDAETTRIFPTGTEKQNRPNKTFDTFVSEMFDALVESYGKFIPIDASKHSLAAIQNILAARRKAEDEARQNANAANARGFHDLPKSQKARLIKAGSPHLSDKEAMEKASLKVDTQKRRRGIGEAVSTNDPNRGKPGRKKPIVPPGLDPYDSVHPFTGKRVKSSGKVQKRLSTLSDAGRNEYYRKVGIRSRAASRGGRTQRLYWGLHEEKDQDL